MQKEKYKNTAYVPNSGNLEEIEAQSSKFQPASLKWAADCFSAHSPLLTSALTARSPPTKSQHLSSAPRLTPRAPRGSPWRAGLAPASRFQGMTGSVSQRPRRFPSPVSEVLCSAGGCEDPASSRGLLQVPGAEVWDGTVPSGLLYVGSVAVLRVISCFPAIAGCVQSDAGTFFLLSVSSEDFLPSVHPGKRAMKLFLGIFTSSSRKAQILKGREKKNPFNLGSLKQF